MDFARFDLEPRLAGFRDEVRAFLDEEFTPEVEARALDRMDEHDPEFYRAVARRGWLIPDLPVADGGAGLDDQQIELLDAEFMARGVPFINISTTRMIFPAVLRYASTEIRDDVVAEVLAGETALTLGYTEPAGGSDIAEVKTRARRTDDGNWVISGAKLYTTGAHHARYTFLLANSTPEAPKGRGLTMFLLPLDLAGVEIQPILTFGERTNASFYDDVVLADRYRLGNVDEGWAVLQGPLDAEHAVGTGAGRPHLDAGLGYARRLARALDAALDWAASRAHRLLDAELATLAEVALLVEQGASTAGLTGRVAGAEGYIQGTQMLMRLLGPDALAAGLGPGGVVQHHHRAAQVSTIYGGTTEVFRNLISRELGLPRPAYKV